MIFDLDLTIPEWDSDKPPCNDRWGRRPSIRPILPMAGYHVSCLCCGPARSLAGPPVAGSGSDGVHVACSEILKRYEERSCFCHQPRRDVGRDELE